MDTLKNWIIALLLMVIASILPPGPDKNSACIAEIKDSFGHVNYIAGQVSNTSIN